MYRIKDFKYLDIYNCGGKKLGVVKDVAIDYHGKKIKGFITSKSIFSKRNFIALENVITMGDSIISKSISMYDGLTFNNIKNLDIMNKDGVMLGMVEELLIGEDFSIKGIITSSSFFDRFFKGKKIYLIGETILGDNNVLYFGNTNISLKAMPHNFFKRDELV